MNRYIQYYLVRLFKTSKFLFAAVCLFIFLNISFNLFFKSEITPIYQWNLYASPIIDQKEYSFVEIIYNNNKRLAFPHTWQEPHKIAFTNPTNYFINAISNKDHDYAKNHYLNNWLPQHPTLAHYLNNFKIYNTKEDLQKFPSWLKRYVEQETKQMIFKIDIKMITVCFDKSGIVKKISSEIVYSIK